MLWLMLRLPLYFKKKKSSVGRMFLLTDGNESEKDFLYLFQVETAEVIGLKGTFDVDPGREVFTLFTTQYLCCFICQTWNFTRGRRGAGLRKDQHQIFSIRSPPPP